MADRNKKSTNKIKINSFVKYSTCLLLCCFTLVIAKSDTPVTNKVKDGVVSALTFEVNVDQSLGKLKFVQQNEGQVKDVIVSSSGVTMILPVKNCTTVSNYSDNKTGIVLETSQITDIVAPMGGVVESIEQSENFKVTIDHGADIKSAITFNGAMAVIKEGSVLKKGDYIGLADKGEKVTFSVIKDGKNQDPLSYIE